MSNPAPIVITGVASGIGEATATLLASQGLELIGIDRATPSSFSGSFIQGDLSTPEGVAAIAKGVRQLAPKGIAGLANIAGVPGTASWQAVFNINVFGLRDLTRSLTSSLLPNSSVVNLASAVAHQWRDVASVCATFALQEDREVALQDVSGHEGLTAESYLFSKQCVRFLTEYFAAELLPHKVRVNSVSPGPVETPILEDFKKNHGRAKVESASQLLGRYGSASDIASVIAFLFSENSSWVNGSDIRVDGGLTAFRNSVPLLNS